MSVRPRMTASQLIARLQELIAADPAYAEVVPVVQGCDCGDDLGDVDAEPYADGTLDITLQRSDSC